MHCVPKFQYILLIFVLFQTNIFPQSPYSLDAGREIAIFGGGVFGPQEVDVVDFAESTDGKSAIGAEDFGGGIRQAGLFDEFEFINGPTTIFVVRNFLKRLFLQGVEFCFFLRIGEWATDDK